MNEIVKAAKSAKKGESLIPSTNSTHIFAAPVKAKSTQTSTVDQDEAPTEKEQVFLVECESDIEQNLQGAFVVGYRLEQIRCNKLYRATYSTFAAYCSKRWDFSKTHANRLIQAYLCQKHLKSIKDASVYVPTKEAQVRWISDLKPEQQVEVASAVYEAVGDKEASAGDFGAARLELYPKPVRKPKATQELKEVKQDEVASSKVPLVFDNKLVSFTEIGKKLQNLSYIFTNSAKKQDGINLIAKIQKDLEQWADWQETQVNGKATI